MCLPARPSSMTACDTLDYLGMSLCNQLGTGTTQQQQQQQAHIMAMALCPFLLCPVLHAVHILMCVDVVLACAVA